MRATPILGVAFAFVAMSACGRTVIDDQREPARGVAAPVADPYRASRKAPGQTRLSAYDPETRRSALAASPAATFSSYGGDTPPLSRYRPAALERASANRAVPRTPRPGPVPKRDIVDLGLERDGGEARSRSKPRAADRDLALASAPAPIPRPVAATPRPALRPVVAAAPAPVPAAPAPTPVTLPPRPSVATSNPPSLFAPATPTDRTPTGLPTFATADPGFGSPLGKVPASLGAANIRTAEAAPLAVDGLEQSSAGETGAIDWDEVVALMEAGEVRSFDDIGQFEILFTLCSGRGVISTQPTPEAIFDVAPPKIVCGVASE